MSCARLVTLSTQSPAPKALFPDPPTTLNWGYMAPNTGQLGPNRVWEDGQNSKVQMMGNGRPLYSSYDRGLSYPMLATLTP